MLNRSFSTRQQVLDILRQRLFWLLGCGEAERGALIFKHCRAKTKKHGVHTWIMTCPPGFYGYHAIYLFNRIS